MNANAFAAGVLRRHARLIHRLAIRHQVDGYLEVDDLRQEAAVVLSRLLASSRVDPETPEWDRLFTASVKNHMIDLRRRATLRRDCHPVSAQDYDGIPDAMACPGRDLLISAGARQDPYRMLADLVEQRRTIETMLSALRRSLTPRSARVLDVLLSPIEECEDPKTRQRVATAAGLSRHQARSALREIREQFVALAPRHLGIHVPAHMAVA